MSTFTVDGPFQRSSFHILASRPDTMFRSAFPIRMKGNRERTVPENRDRISFENELRRINHAPIFCSNIGFWNCRDHTSLLYYLTPPNASHTSLRGCFDTNHWRIQEPVMVLSACPGTQATKEGNAKSMICGWRIKPHYENYNN